MNETDARRTTEPQYEPGTNVIGRDRSDVSEERRKQPETGNGWLFCRHFGRQRDKRREEKSKDPTSLSTDTCNNYIFLLNRTHPPWKIRDETQQKVSDWRVVFCWTCLMVGSSDLAGRLLRAQGFGLGNSDQSDLFLTYGRWEFEYLNPHLHMNTNVFPIVRSHPREFPIMTHGNRAFL